MLKKLTSLLFCIASLNLAGAPLFTPSIDPARGNTFSVEWLRYSDFGWNSFYSMPYFDWRDGSVSSSLYVSHFLYQMSSRVEIGFSMGLRNVFQSSVLDPYSVEYREAFDKLENVLARVSMQYGFTKNFKTMSSVELTTGSCYSNNEYSGYRSHYMSVNCSAHARSSFDSFGIDQ
jgi:hypothetical protein